MTNRQVFFHLIPSVPEGKCRSNPSLIEISEALAIVVPGYYVTARRRQDGVLRAEAPQATIHCLGSLGRCSVPCSPSWIVH